MKEVVIVSAVRTPIGSFNGSLSALSATQLGAVAIKAAIEKAGISGNQIDEVFMGNVLQANVGQSPVTQAARFAGIPDHVPGTTIIRVCAAGMKEYPRANQPMVYLLLSLRSDGEPDNSRFLPSCHKKLFPPCWVYRRK